MCPNETTDKIDAFPLSDECLDRPHVNTTVGDETFLYYRVAVDFTLSILVVITNMVLIVAIVEYREHYKGTIRLYNSSASMKFVINLAASDLSMGLAVLLYATTQYSCDVNEYIKSLGRLCVCKYIPPLFAQINSSLSLIAIAADRYIAVFRSFQYREIMTDRVCYLIIASTWLVSFGISSILFFWNNWRPNTNCALEDVAPLAFMVVLDSGFHGAVIAMIGGIHYKLRQKAVESNSQRSSIVSSESKSNIKATRLVLLVIGVYLLCWAPFCVVNIIGMTECEESRFIYYTLRMVYPLRNSYSLINPFVYAWKNLEIRESVKWFLKKSVRRNKRNVK